MAKRQCDECKTLMGPYLPRKRKGDQYLCSACFAKPRGGYISAEASDNPIHLPREVTPEKRDEWLAGGHPGFDEHGYSKYHDSRRWKYSPSECVRNGKHMSLEGGPGYANGPGTCARCGDPEKPTVVEPYQQLLMHKMMEGNESAYDHAEWALDRQDQGPSKFSSKENPNDHTIYGDGLKCSYCGEGADVHPHPHEGEWARCSLCNKDMSHSRHDMGRWEHLETGKHEAPVDLQHIWDTFGEDYPKQAARDQQNCPHDGGWNLHGQCKKCGYLPPTEGDEPCDDEWCVEHEPEHTKAEHIDPPHRDPGHPDYHAAEQGVEDAIGEHPDAWLLDHNDEGPSKFSKKATWIGDHIPEEPSLYWRAPNMKYEVHVKNHMPDRNLRENYGSKPKQEVWLHEYDTSNPNSKPAKGYLDNGHLRTVTPWNFTRKPPPHVMKHVRRAQEHVDANAANHEDLYGQVADHDDIRSDLNRVPREMADEQKAHDMFKNLVDRANDDDTDEGKTASKTAAGGLGDAMKGVIDHMTHEHGVDPLRMGQMMRETQGGTPPVPAAETPKWNEDPQGLTNHVNSMVAWHNAMHTLHKDVLHHGDYMQHPTDPTAYKHVHGPEDDLTHPKAGYEGYTEDDGTKRIYDPHHNEYSDNTPVVRGNDSPYAYKNELSPNRWSRHRTDRYPNLKSFNNGEDHDTPEMAERGETGNMGPCSQTYKKPDHTSGEEGHAAFWGDEDKGVEPAKCEECGAFKWLHAEHKPSEIGKATDMENRRRQDEFKDRVQQTGPLKPLPQSLNNKRTAADERDLWRSWEEGMSPKDKPEGRGVKPVGINDCYVCNQPTNPHSFQKQDDGTYMCPRCSHAKNQHSEHDVGWHDYTPGPPPDAGYGRFEPNRNLFSLNKKTAHQQEIEMKYAPVARLIHASGIQVVAHDSGDGETIYHCPFCGSGQVVARSDGTVECEFCHTAFTVQVQPEMSAFPQTINGVPVDVPGMPGEIGAEAPMNPADLDPGAETGAPGDGAFPPGGEGGDVEADNEEKEEDSGPPKFSSLKTDKGVDLPMEDFIRHVAIKHASNREFVVEAIRNARNK